MPSIRSSLTRELRNAGITRAAVDAVWPEWWSNEAESSVSATAELRYTVARRLGISPRSLFEGQPKFVWRSNAKFKNLGDTNAQEQAILTSFGMAVGRALVGAINPVDVRRFSPEALRNAVLEQKATVDLRDILPICWQLGIPVVKTNLVPLKNKHMQAMAVGFRDQYAIIVGRTTRYPAWMAFVIAHELGHIFSGHVNEDAPLLEMGDPLQTSEPDDEERAADEFALTFLTGNASYPVVANVERYNAQQVAEVVTREAPRLGVDPGVLALCLAHSTGRWPQTMAALKLVPEQFLNEEAGLAVNWFASQQIDWERLSGERAAYLRTVMGPISDQ